MAIISTINAAAGAINKVAGTCNDLNTIGSFVGKLGQAQVDLQAYHNKNRNNLSQEELIQITLAKKQYQDRMNEIRELFIYSGNAHLWDEIQMEMANARKRRIAEMRAKEAARKRAVRITLWAGFILIVALAVFLAMLYAISTYAEPLITDQMTIILTLLGGLPLW
jgi:cation transport ATPase